MVHSSAECCTAASASRRTARLAEGKLVKIAVVLTKTARFTPADSNCRTSPGTWPKPMLAQYTTVPTPSNGSEGFARSA
jgi:hypothetical protein